MPRCNGRVGSFCDEQPRNGSSREMRLEELTSLLLPLWRFPHSGERIMKNILPPLLQRCRWTKKKIRGKKKSAQTEEKPQGCSIMQLPGRGWWEGRAAPSDSSGEEEEAQREQLNYSQGIKGTGILSLQPPASAWASPLLFAWLGTSFHPKITEMSFSMAPPYPSLLQRADWHSCPFSSISSLDPFPTKPSSASCWFGDGWDTWAGDLPWGFPVSPGTGAARQRSLGVRNQGLDCSWGGLASLWVIPAKASRPKLTTAAAAGVGWQPHCHTWCKQASRWEGWSSIPAASAKSRSNYSCHWRYQWLHLRLFSFFPFSLLFSAAVASQ